MSSFDPIPPRESSPDRVDYARLPDDVLHPKLRQLYEHWQAARGTREMPARADIDPLSMPGLLGNLLLIDVVAADPPQFRYRLIGSRLTERLGRDMTGRTFDEVPEPVYRQRLYAWHGGVVATRKPRGGRTARRILERWAPFEILTLPLSNDGAQVHMTWTGVFYLDELG